jgi:hypothetical protein
VVSSIWRQGVTGTYRRSYWRFLRQTLRHTPKRLARAIALACAGEHMIRYTEEAVLPRLTNAIEEVRQKDAEAARKVSKTVGLRARPHLPIIPAIDDSIEASV